MINLRILISFLVVLLVPALTSAELRVVTTLNTFADITKSIGGDRVVVHAVAAPRFNPHFIEARPSDVVSLKRADLFIHGGLDLEVWRGPLVDAAGNPAVRPGGERELDLSIGIPLLEVPISPISRAEGDIHIFGNPHYTLDPRNARIMATAIETKLSSVDPDGASYYKTNLVQFLQELEARISKWSDISRGFKSREIIAYHKEWEYLANFLTLKIVGYLEPKPGVPPAPKHILELATIVQQRNIHGIIQASYFPREAADDLAARSGGKVGVVCQNVGELPQCESYIKMIDYDVEVISSLLGDK